MAARIRTRYGFGAGALAPAQNPRAASDNPDVMRMIGLLFAALIALGAYYYFLKRAAPAPGTVVTQTISTTGVEMDLNSIAQAERMYFAQNGSYAGLDQLTSSGTMNIARTGRDGYTYSIETEQDGFTVVARHPEVPASSGVTPPHFPVISVDQNMQFREE
jgi:hypothetical protein